MEPIEIATIWPARIANCRGLNQILTLGTGMVIFQ